jgi:DNA mismatch endonuclease (patch repair protein)
MSGIKGKNSLPEMLVRKALFAMGHRYRLHRRDLPGTPDIVMPRRKIAIFVHGCFWHAHLGCKYAKMPSTRTEFWVAKLQRNVDRDRSAAEKLVEKGWRVLNLWGFSTRDPSVAGHMPDALREWIETGQVVGEISAKSLVTVREG